MMFTTTLLTLTIAALELAGSTSARPIRQAQRTHSSGGMLRQHRALSLRRRSTDSTSTTSVSFENMALFPSGQGSSNWTTSPALPNALPLSDATFDLFDDESVLSHNYVSAPDGSQAMQVNYAKGSFDLDHAPYGGVSFYANGPNNVDLSTAKEATFGYSVYFESGFDFVLGGKLPGLYGGNNNETAVSCSGGRISSSCFSARLMWRTAGMGELYTYLPPVSQFPANEVQCSVKPFSTCNPTYGASVGRGSFNFTAGAWNTVSQRVKLNDEGQDNGELELFHNGNSVVNVSGLVLRNSSEGRIWGIQMQSFFGGHSSEYESPKNQSAWFKDFSAAITETL